MGYYTEHTLTVKRLDNKKQFEELEQELKEKEILRYAVCEGEYSEDLHEAYFSCYDSVKWYDHEKDMAEIAEKFPNVYFELEGNGEEFGDFWREYYHGLISETCRGEIIFEKPTKVYWPA